MEPGMAEQDDVFNKLDALMSRRRPAAAEPAPPLKASIPVLTEQIDGPPVAPQIPVLEELVSVVAPAMQSPDPLAFLSGLERAVLDKAEMRLGQHLARRLDQAMGSLLEEFRAEISKTIREVVAEEITRQLRGRAEPPASPDSDAGT
jgi:hypothetical protein